MCACLSGSSMCQARTCTHSHATRICNNHMLTLPFARTRTCRNIHARTHARTHTHTHTHTCTHARMHTQTHTCMHAQSHASAPNIERKRKLRRRNLQDTKCPHGGQFPQNMSEICRLLPWQICGRANYAKHVKQMSENYICQNLNKICPTYVQKIIVPPRPGFEMRINCAPAVPTTSSPHYRGNRFLRAINLQMLT
jgi:hypothetical protein